MVATGYSVSPLNPFMRMNKDRLILAVGVVSLLLGATWVAYMILSPSSLPGFTTNEGWLELLISLCLVFFFSFVLILFALPGGLAMYHGFSLLKQSSRSAIKGTVAGVAVMATISFNARVGVAFTKEFHDPNSDFVFMITDVLLLITSLIMLRLYITTSRALIARAGLGHMHFGDLAGKGTALLFAFLLWSTGTSMTEFLVSSRISEGSEWMGLLHFVPIILAWGFYRLTARFLDQHKSPQAMEVDPRGRAKAGV